MAPRVRQPIWSNSFSKKLLAAASPTVSRSFSHALRLLQREREDAVNGIRLGLEEVVSATVAVHVRRSRWHRGPHDPRRVPASWWRPGAGAIGKSAVGEFLGASWAMHVAAGMRYNATHTLRLDDRHQGGV